MHTMSFSRTMLVLRAFGYPALVIGLALIFDDLEAILENTRQEEGATARPVAVHVLFPGK